MASKESKTEKEKSFAERFKRFLKTEMKNLKYLPELKLSSDIIQQLGPEFSFPIRLKAIREIEELLVNTRLAEDELEIVYRQTNDLLKVDNPREQKEAVLTLFGVIISNLDKLGHNRIIFSTSIKQNYKTEDPNLLFDFFRCLVSDGRHIDYIEEVVGPLLLDWLPKLLTSYKTPKIAIELITNLLKFNAAHIDDYILHELVLVIINKLWKANDNDELLACLSFMETLIAYAYIPNGTLNQFITVLARLVSIPPVVDDVWKVMRNLLRTELGNTAVCSLCEIIENSDDFHIVRGSIYFITNALWTKGQVKSLTLTPMAILPTLLKASSSLHPLVIYETAISLSKLVRNFSQELHLASWDLLLVIIERLLYYTANYNVPENSQMIFNVLNAMMDDIEDRIAANQFWGTLSKFYNLVDQYSEQRSDNSVLHMLDYKFKKLKPNQPHWVNNLTSLMYKHFRKDLRPAIRLKAVSNLRSIIDNFMYSDTIAICNSVILTQMDEVDQDKEMIVRKAAVSLLVHIILSIQDPVIEKLLRILEKIVLSPYSANDVESVSHPKVYNTIAEAEDILEGIKGSILIFKRKMWCLPSCYAIQAYQICMTSVEFHYRMPKGLEKLPLLRKLVFEMIFEMRADATYHLGLPECVDAQIPVNNDDPVDLIDLLPKYTPYIIVDHKFGQKPISCFPIYGENLLVGEVDADNEEIVDIHDEEKSLAKPTDENFIVESSNNSSIAASSHENNAIGSFDPSPTVGSIHESENISNLECNGSFADDCELSPLITHLSLTKAARIVIVAMKQEKEWSLLKMILERVPQVLQNKALILSKDGNDIDYLATTLCSLVTEKKLNLPGSLYNTPPKFSESDFQGYVFPVMATLASYHQHLDFTYQLAIIQCLRIGMLSKSGPLCVNAMTICVLEMRTAMTKMLMDIMLTLSQISATVQNAQPTLEFLSTLLHLPTVYSDFSRKQTCTVFAISIPYTNPFKFNHYIVSLAYHVICMWFLKCRLPYRKHFVNYLAKNLNMILLNEEAPKKLKSGASNEQITKKGDIDMIQFHKDLRETCVDFMARNCFDTYSPVVKRSEVSQLLLKTGQQQSWLIGTRIVTVTTSGCSKRPIRQGLCDNCIQICGVDTEPSPPGPLPPQDFSASRRRHKSEFHRSVSHEAKHLPHSKDDLHMRPSQDSSNLESSSGFLPEKKQYLCACWCRGWAEIFIRQPTGNISYMVYGQNPRTQISKDQILPVHELSTFYSPSDIIGDDNLLHKLDPSDMDFGACSPEMLDNMRPRALSGGSEPTQASETGVGLATDWSNSGSVPSSGEASLNSSELKLDTKMEVDNVEEEVQSHPVSHCYSNPEVHKGMNLETTLPDRHPRHQILSHSMSLVENSTSSILSESNKEDSIALPGINKRISGIGRQGNNSANSPSTPSLLLADEVNRIRHASALQMKTSPSSVIPSEKEEDDLTDANLQPIKRGRGHTISDMNPASRNITLRNVFSRRPTLANTGSLALNTVSTTSLPSEASASVIEPVTVSSSSSSSNRSCKDITKGGVSPSSVFLQLYYQGCFGGSCFRPILLPPEHESSIKVLDLVNLQADNTTLSDSVEIWLDIINDEKLSPYKDDIMSRFKKAMEPFHFLAHLTNPKYEDIDINKVLPLLEETPVKKPHEHHKIGVLYVGPNQSEEAEILRNVSGSERYYCFLEGLGSIYELKDLVTDNINIGGLDKRGVDGNLVYMWQDDLMQVVFHVATAIPNKDTDKNCNNKKRHIGNDCVTIVYNNSGKPYRYNTIKSQFNHFVIEIIPGDLNTNCVKVIINPEKQELSELVSWGKNDTLRLVSDISLPVLVRQLALHANLASTVWQSLKISSCTPYATTWLDRLRKIRKLREKILGKEEADKHLQDMQELQFPLTENPNDEQNLSFLDFSDMIEIEKSEPQDRKRTACFLNRR